VLLAGDGIGFLDPGLGEAGGGGLGLLGLGQPDLGLRFLLGGGLFGLGQGELLLGLVGGGDGLGLGLGDLLDLGLFSALRGEGDGDLFLAVRFHGGAQVLDALLFLGDGRTGSALTGSLIDAHPDACVALEENALDHVTEDVARDALFERLAANSARHRKLRWIGYSYRVPGQSQGRSEAPRVIGDKPAGIQTVRLVEEPELWRRLYDLVEVRVKAIHSVRNPYDVIATRFRWKSRNATLDAGARAALLDWLIDDHFRICEAAARFARGHAGVVDVLHVAHEPFVADPVAMLRRVCDFLGLPATADYLQDCSRVVAPSPRRSRSEVEWTEPQLREVARRAAAFAFLDGYSFDS